jgi:hypothetical protein
MRRSIIGAVIDLLHFERHGNFGQFDRFFRKASALFSLNMDEPTVRKLRNIAFWYLRNAGYIDVNYSRSATIWATAPPNLVQRSEQEFVLIGSSAQAASVSAAAPGGAILPIRAPDGGLVPADIAFFPEMICLKLSVLDAQAISRETRIPLGMSYQERLFQHLPSVDSVRSGAVVRDGDRAFEPDDTDRFDFATCTWDRFRDTRPSHAGLYRQSFRHGLPTYVIAAPTLHERLGIFRALEHEWVLVSALTLLRHVIPVKYDRGSRRLYVSRKYHRAFRLPTLLERSFRSGTLLNPSFQEQWTVYDGIVASSVKRLAEKLPVFYVEGE